MSRDFRKKRNIILMKIRAVSTKRANQICSARMLAGETVVPAIRMSLPDHTANEKNSLHSINKQPLHFPREIS